jgi:glycosyltransferase involved in cell wall biosynthesis
MKRVLMIIPFFPPMGGGGVYRPLSMVKYLSRNGWEPTVVAPRGDAFWIRDDGLERQVPQECHVVRTDTLSGQSILARRRGEAPAAQRRSSRGFGLARRVASALLMPDTYRGWIPYAMRAARGVMRERSFDAIYSTSPPETSHLIARKLHNETGLPWVADFRDPWMNLHLLPRPTPLHTWLHRRMERSVCERAHVVVTTRWHEALLRDRYRRSPSITRISNGYDAGEAEGVAGVLPPPKPFRITHAGMLTQNRSAVPFLNGLWRFLDARPEAANDVDVLFVGAREDANERAAKELNLSKQVRFADTSPHSETLKTQRASHILLLIKHVNPDYDGLVPGKLYEYVGMRRPILALAPSGEARDIVEKLGRGETPKHDDPVDIARAIDRLYDAYREGALEERYDLSPRPELTRERLAEKMAAVLDAAVTSKRK